MLISRRNEFTTWPGRFLGEPEECELSQEGWPQLPVKETRGQIQKRLGQEMRRENRPSIRNSDKYV